MELIEFTFNNNTAPTNSGWSLEGLKLSKSNLIVGNNSAGKSRTINKIRMLANTISNYSSFKLQNGHNLVSLKLTISKTQEIFYQISMIKHELIELLSCNGNILLERKGDQGKIFSQVQNKFIQINPPDDKIVLHVRRDKDEFPYLEYIAAWAENTRFFNFSHESPKKTTNSSLTRSTSEIINKLSKKSISKIIETFNVIGFEVNNIYTEESKDRTTIYFEEKGIDGKIPHYQLSQGMFRTFSLIVFIQDIIESGKNALVLIDDLAEGLDYKRATNLGKWLFEAVKNTNIQLIATSNDSFLMDVVDIEHWNILIREKTIVSAYNYQNSKELFDNFVFSGLSNFDLFSSDYLASKIK